MSVRSELDKKITKKREELEELKRKLRDAEVWIQALEDAAKVLPRDGVNEGDADTILRAGGNAAEARNAILAHRRPLHIDELLSAMGKNVTRSNRTSVSGALSAYVRKEEVFTRPAPNTFGLMELTRQGIPEGLDSGTAEDDSIQELDSTPYGDVGGDDDDVPF